jgi:hypothetical protein
MSSIPAGLVTSPGSISAFIRVHRCSPRGIAAIIPQGKFVVERNGSSLALIALCPSRFFAAKQFPLSNV